jgi:hypothetical protein
MGAEDMSAEDMSVEGSFLRIPAGCPGVLKGWSGAV